MTLAKKVLLIGWDAADWKVITPLIDAGKMPNLKRFLSQGVMGNIATLYPAFSPMLWTSIATGKRPFKHGIHGFIEPDPGTGGVRPITNLGRTTKAIWNILNQNDKRCNVVSWWPSHPAEPINGVMVSNAYPRPGKSSSHQSWPMAPGTVHPARLAEPLAELRVHPSEIEGEQLLPFVPRAWNIDQKKDPRLHSLATVLAECASVHAAATGLMQLEPWDFMAIYYEAIDEFSHGFMRYHPPRSPWINEEDFELYKEVIEGAYRFHDAMLGTLMALAGEDTTMILVSDHGFHPDHLRPQYLPNEPAGPAEEHRPFGIFAMKGPGIKKDELVFGTSLLDITPTILSLFGLPIGEDMDGKPVTTAFENPPKIEYVESWDEVEGDAGTHPPNLQISPTDSQEAIQQLIDLGYVEALDEDKTQQVAEVVRELRYNLACSYIGANRYSEALPILEELWEAWPDKSCFGVQIFRSYLALRQTEKARITLDKIMQRKQEYALKAQEELKELLTVLRDKKNEDVTEAEQYRLRVLQKKAQTNLPTLAYLQGSLLQAEGRFEESISYLEKAKDTQIHNLPSLYKRIGDGYLAEKKWLKAESYFLQVLEIDPINADAHIGLCRSYLKQRRNEEALKEAMATIGLIYFNPQAHFLCGVALHRCGYIEDAIKAFKTAVSQNPIFPLAYRRLALIYSQNIRDVEQANHYRKLARESHRRLHHSTPESEGNPTPATVQEWLNTVNTNPIRQTPVVPLEDSIVIVSGLPRSGTSMMMQMLAAGGLPVVTDHTRRADESNALGYYEFEPVKQLARDNRFLGEMKGKAVKIIAQLLPNLPPKQPCRIIFMNRHLGEVIASQEKMLTKLGRKGSSLSREKLAQTFAQQVDNVKHLLHQYPEMSLLELNYHEVIENPRLAAKQINEFLGGGLDTDAIAAAVVPELRHQQALPALVSR